MNDIPNGFYRVSIKALILDDTRQKFAVILEDNGWWELPGGGMDFGETPQDCMRRELKEEMGLTVTRVADEPKYVLVGKNMKDFWAVGLVYETAVADLNYKRSDECVELRFISPDEVKNIKAFRTVTELANKLAGPARNDTK